MISEHNQLKHIIMPIFEEFHLNSSKYLNYEDFKLILEMRKNKGHLLAENKEKILKIKGPPEGGPSRRDELPEIKWCTTPRNFNQLELAIRFY